MFSSGCYKVHGKQLNFAFKSTLRDSEKYEVYGVALNTFCFFNEYSVDARLRSERCSCTQIYTNRSSTRK